MLSKVNLPVSRVPTLDTAVTLDGFSLTITVGYQGVHPKMPKSFWRWKSVRFRSQRLAIESFYYTLDTLDRRKKTKGYSSVAVQGVQGSAGSPLHTLVGPSPRPGRPSAHAPDAWGHFPHTQGVGGSNLCQGKPLQTDAPPNLCAAKMKTAESKMPKPGRKPDSTADKQARGTLRPSRDQFATVATPSPVIAIQPPDLPYDVAIVWTEYLADAVAHGARQCDADSFAQWCTMTAHLRQSRAAPADGLPPASYIQQWRTLGELFGLAGPKSRVGRTLDGPEKPNPFLRRLPP